MAYNLQSLITILHQTLNPKQRRWILHDHNKAQLESLLEKAASLKQLIHENSSGPKLESLETQIRDAAYKAEDLIESHMFDQMRSHKVVRFFIFMLSHICVRFTFFTQDLEQVTQELDSAKEKVVELMEEKKMSSGSSSSSGAAFLPDPTSKKIVVGVDEDLLQLMDRLTGMQSEQLEIVPIVGMGGIDINNGSRIVLTTRESNVARCVGTVGSQHKVRLLQKSESWNLLHQIVFGEDQIVFGEGDCPDVLQGIGREIAGDCRGLPLAINVIGGVLSKAERSRDVWEHIAKECPACILVDSSGKNPL